MSSAHLLTLPRELRDHIWSLAFSDITITPFPTRNHDWFFHAARRQCYACPGADSSEFPCSKDVFRPLLACKQLYHEAYDVLRGSMCLRIDKPGDLEDIRQSSRSTLRSSLRYLRLIIHLNDNSRERWKHELCTLPTTFPSLERLDIYNHMHPPICFQNLSDAVYLAGPIVHFPATMIPQLHFAYTEDDEMFSSEELGVIYYRDALDAHSLVVRALVADTQFKEHSRTFSLEPMVNCLLGIAQSYEQPWLDSMRRRRGSQEGGATVAA